MLVAPARARANSWEDVADLSASFGLILDPWQEQVLQAAMGERTDGKWAAPQVAISAPRQNGKSQLIVARALAGALLFDEKLIVISAHQADTARETFGKFMEQIESNAALESRLYGGSIRSGVMNAINREHIKFANGSTIKFKARTGAGGRGFSSDCLFLDEAQRLSGAAWASINSTMSARVNPQAWLMGTPPTPEDDGEVFTRIRAKALGGKSTSLAYLEWSAEATDDPALEETRAKANPAWYTRINHDIVNGEFDTYSPEQFALERLGIWSDEESGTPGLDPVAWGRGLDHASQIDGPVSFGVAMSPDKSTVTISTVGRRADQAYHGEVAEQRKGTSWVAPWLAQRVPEHGAVATVIDPASGAASLIPEIERAGVVVDLVTVGELAAACGRLHDLVTEGAFRHIGQAPLTTAVAGSKAHELTRGGWLWRPRGPESIAPLNALTLALAGYESKLGGDPAMNVW